ncbi:MAG TPA: VIT domain-containing protein, partial [Tepidisphaeraceae bacterium]|nr:VIT domain-containing protein [Tepidisphaeraceae bacterium]
SAAHGSPSGMRKPREAAPAAEAVYDSTYTTAVPPNANARFPGPSVRRDRTDLSFNRDPSMPSLEEEIWVIRRPPQNLQEVITDPVPGSGTIVTRDATRDQLVPVPLKHTDVNASIAGYVATVDVVQQFHNPYAGKIEAIYVFPLPHNAAVNEFVMAVGDRRIRGIIRERQEAEQVYEQAKRQGYVATLLTQERPNVFTQAVANIEPGKQIEVQVRYFHTLSYSDGWYEFAFPMVVGPRFNPPGSTEGVGAAGRGSRGVSGQKTEVQYLRPGERSGNDVAVTVELDAGMPVEKIESRTHRVSVARRDPARAQITLDAGDRIPNKDFVLRWKVAGEGIKSSLVVQRAPRDGEGEAGGHFSLMLLPPDDLKWLPRTPLEMVFTLDVSGSMNGRPIEQAKDAVRYALRNLGPDDTFQIIRFSSNAESMAPHPVPATPQNVQAALQYLNGTSAGGGTMMLDGIRQSLEFPADESRPRYVAFLTDGYIGNETEILGALHRSLGTSRVFSFGVGSSVNRYLLEHMAKLGRGAVAYLGPQDQGAEVMAAYLQRIRHPALTNLSIDWGGANVEDVFPERLPDLFVGRPVIVTGRYTGQPPRTVKVTGKVRGEEQTVQVAAADDEAPAAASAANTLPLVWARMKIADLADREAYEPRGDLPQQVRHVALEHGLMSAYTSFVAVDSLTRTQGTHGTTVATPVPVPDGVKYETTVQEAGLRENPKPE